MSRNFRLPGRRFLIASLAVGLVGMFVMPAIGLFSTSVIHFYANFNDALMQGPSANKSWNAFGGQATVMGDQDVFEVVFPTPENGEVEVVENVGADDSELVCEFDSPAFGDSTNVSFSLTLMGGYSDLRVRFDDVGDTGVLDMEFTEDRHLRIDGKALPLPLQAGETDLFVDVVLQTLLTGSQVYSLTLTGPSASTATMGILSAPSLTLSNLHFIREAGSLGGRWRIDDVLVSSQDSIYNTQYELGAPRK